MHMYGFTIEPLSSALGYICQDPVPPRLKLVFIMIV